MSCQRRSFMGNPFHQISISAKSVGVVIYNIIAVSVVLCGQMAFCHGHTYSHADSLTQWSCGGFYTYGVTILRMSWCLGSPLSEILQFFHGKSVSSHMQHGIQESGSMSCREHKTVSVEPGRVFRIVHHVLCPEHICKWCSSQRKSRMSGVCFLDGVNRQRTDGIDG